MEARIPTDKERGQREVGISMKRREEGWGRRRSPMKLRSNVLGISLKIGIIIFVKKEF